MTAPASSLLRVKNKHRFGIVPDRLLEDKRLSLSARAVAAWLAGRGDGFEIHIGTMRRILGISEFVWKRTRKELENIGWWNSERITGPGGTFCWEHEFEYLDQTDQTIPKFPMDGSPMDGKLGDITIGDYQKDLTKEEKTTTTDDVVGDSSHKIDEKADGCAVLREAGVNGRMAGALSRAHSLARIREVVDLAREKERANPAGFIVMALKEGWQAGESQGIHSKGTNIDDLIARAKAQEAKDGGRDAEKI